MTAPADDRHRFRLFYAAHFDALLGYALRRVAHPDDAADVVGETFLVAWRRVDDLPPDDEGRLWLYGVARKVLANQRRATRRRDRLGDRVRERISTLVTPDPAGEVAHRVDVVAALGRLGEVDREVLTLAIWEELEPREIAAVLGIRPEAVRTRLSRARARLRDALGDGPAPSGHVSLVRTAYAEERS